MDVLDCRGVFGEYRDHVMLWVACCMLFLGCCCFCLRAGEVTVPSLCQYDSACHLSVGDVKLDSLGEPCQYQGVKDGSVQEGSSDIVG